MKILKNERYSELIKNEEILKDYKVMKSMYEKTIAEMTNKINYLNKKVSDKERARKKLACKIGGMQTELNRLKGKANESDN